MEIYISTKKKPWIWTNNFHACKKTWYSIYQPRTHKTECLDVWKVSCGLAKTFFTQEIFAHAQANYTVDTGNSNASMPCSQERISVHMFWKLWKSFPSMQECFPMHTGKCSPSLFKFFFARLHVKFFSCMWQSLHFFFWKMSLQGLLRNVACVRFFHC